MRARRLVLTLSCLSLLLAMPVAASDDALKEKVATLGEELAAAMVAGDVDAMMSFYHDDAISLPNYGPRMDGVAAFRQAHEESSAMGMEIVSFESTPTEVWTAGDQVIEIGQWQIEMEMNDQPLMNDHGTYLTIWEPNEDGVLKVKVETWNTDVNPMESAEDSDGENDDES